ncbi:DUF4124 domain-containing protein [Reinekea marinisedimentorum]|uniref:DUF4124 domain-containing protein n=1 Tax=Reinekea marinisedimentorum TaxID=230495 RepID=A0A4R3I8B4_9GAMM|nr:DUF4124 domain-containing protein [Reinekea marinisedimentorum]TCS40427.1 hypothetical protein BCF53_109137 [Reinekea marinisedimentorum]
MKQWLSLILFTLPLSGYAAGINQCVKPDGSMYFSNLPCPEKAELVNTIKPASSSGIRGSMCAERNQAIREIICDNKSIEPYFTEHKELYNALLSYVGSKKNYRLVSSAGVDDSGEKWNEERDKCKTESCVIGFYTSRIDILKNLKRQSVDLDAVADLPGVLARALQHRYGVSSSAWQVRYAKRIPTRINVVGDAQYSEITSLTIPGPVTVIVALVEDSLITVDGRQSALTGTINDYLGVYAALDDAGNLIDSHYFVGNRLNGNGFRPYVDISYGMSDSVYAGQMYTTTSGKERADTPIRLSLNERGFSHVWKRKGR